MNELGSERWADLPRFRRKEALSYAAERAAATGETHLVVWGRLREDWTVVSKLAYDATYSVIPGLHVTDTVAPPEAAPHRERSMPYVPIDLGTAMPRPCDSFDLVTTAGFDAVHPDERRARALIRVQRATDGIVRRLADAQGLEVEIADGGFIVSGGREPHAVTMDGSACDCLDYADGLRICKHRAAVLLHRGESSVSVLAEMYADDTRRKAVAA